MEFELSIQERAEEVITPIVEKLGYEVVEIRYERIGKKNSLTVFIYKKGGISLEDCVKVNAELDMPLELADITHGAPYDFSVSSPGLDRPIVTDKDYARNIDETVEGIYIKPVGKSKKIVGILLSHDDDKIYLNVKGKNVQVNKSDISVLRPYIDMKSLKSN